MQPATASCVCTVELARAVVLLNNADHFETLLVVSVYVPVADWSGHTSNNKLQLKTCNSCAASLCSTLDVNVQLLQLKACIIV